MRPSVPMSKRFGVCFDESMILQQPGALRPPCLTEPLLMTLPFASLLAWLALAAGVVADLYFWGIIGIYTFILPALSAFGRWYARVFPELFVFRLLGNIVAITVSCLYTWLVFRLVGWTDLTLKAIGFSLLYTAGWTTGISLATYWLWAKLARSYPFLVDLDNYRY